MKIKKKEYVFQKMENKPHEQRDLGGVIAYKAKSKKAETFFELKGALSSLFDRLGINGWFDDQPPLGGHVFHPYRSAYIKVGEEAIGMMGEVHPALLERTGIKGEGAMFELALEPFTRLISEEKEFRLISKFPSVVRDIALLVPLDTSVEAVSSIIENTAGEMLIDSDLFDIYEGGSLPEDKKSLAFRLVFQSHEQTLRDDEVDKIMEKTKSELEKNLEWEVR